MNLVRPTLVLVAFVAACGGEQKPAEPPSAVTTQTQSPSASNERQPVGNNLTVTGEIYRLCQLRAQSAIEAAPKFAFDTSAITKNDAVVLDQVARCLTTGPLAHRRVALTGRADPRGTEEYNMTLGAKRADAVASYLERGSVPSTNLDQTSRGALDATGSSDATWAKDRRVDIALAP